MSVPRLLQFTAITVAVVAAASIVTAVVTGQRAAESGGPLASDVVAGVEVRREVGQTSTWGVYLRRPAAGAEAILESATVAQMQGDITVVAIVASRPSIQAVGTAAGFPPDGVPTIAVQGASAGAGDADRLQLLVGVRLDGKGGRIDGIRIRYTSEGRLYETVLPVWLSVAAD